MELKYNNGKFESLPRTINGPVFGVKYGCDFKSRKRIHAQAIHFENEFSDANLQIINVSFVFGALLFILSLN